MRHLLACLTVATALVVTAAAAPDAEALNPSRTYKQLPDKYNMKYEAADVKTEDGATLKMWRFPAKDKASTAVVLIAHNGEGNMADYLRRVDALTAKATVYTFDYRGFGESSEFEIDNNMFIYPHFVMDLEAAIDHVRKSATATFSLYGWGMGGGLALGVGYGRPEIKAIIADTPFLSMEDLETRFESWDTPMEVPFAGYDKRHEPITAVEGAPGKHLARVKLIVGSNDRLMKKADMAKLVAASTRGGKKVDKDVFVVENPDRKDNFQVAKAKYIAVLQAALAAK